MTNLDLQFSEKTSFKRIAGKGPQNTNSNSPLWTELLCSSFFSLSLLSKSCDSFLFFAGVRGVFFAFLPLPDRACPLARPQGTVVIQFTKILLWDDQIQSLKKRCNAFIPDFFGVHDMYLLVIAIYGHSRWFVCIFGREHQMLHRLQLLRAVLVWTQKKLQQKQEVISDSPKNQRNIFKGKNSISPRV